MMSIPSFVLSGAPTSDLTLIASTSSKLLDGTAALSAGAECVPKDHKNSGVVMECRAARRRPVEKGRSIAAVLPLLLTMSPTCRAYQLSVTPTLTWAKAEDYCVGKGGHLVSIHSNVQQTEVLSFMQSYTSSIYPWIGAWRTGTTGKYSWTDGTVFDYSPSLWSTNDEAPISVHLHHDGAWGTGGGSSQGICDIAPDSATTVLISDPLAEAGKQLHSVLNDALNNASTAGSRARPLFLPATSPQRNALPVSLPSILQPFEGKFSPPFAKMTGDAGGMLASADIPTSTDEVVKLIYSNERRSVVLRLEQLVEDHTNTPVDASLLGPLYDALRPFLPLGTGKGETTAHVYISNEGAAALANHTDITEILVLQLLGRKEWLYCVPDKDKPQLPWLTPKTTLPAKLSKCTTYDAVEMADGSLTCQSVVTAPGDTLFLPRRTVHSARAVPGDVSVHLTIGVTTGMALPDELPVHRRLEECATGCDEACDPSCDGAGCDGAGCDGAGCDGNGCDGTGCDGAGCDGNGCDGAGCDGAGCDEAGCDGAGCDFFGVYDCDYNDWPCDWNTGCDYDQDCDYSDSCDYDQDCDNNESCDYDQDCDYSDSCDNNESCDNDEACNCKFSCLQNIHCFRSLLHFLHAISRRRR
jgi:hypothetical protein